MGTRYRLLLTRTHTENALISRFIDIDLHLYMLSVCVCTFVISFVLVWWSEVRVRACKSATSNVVYFSTWQASGQPTHDDSSQGGCKETVFCLHSSGSSPPPSPLRFPPVSYLWLQHSCLCVPALPRSLSSSFSYSLPSVCFSPPPLFSYLSCTHILAGWTSWPDGSLTVSVCLNSGWTSFMAACGIQCLASTTCGPSVYLSLVHVACLSSRVFLFCFVLFVTHVLLFNHLPKLLSLPS